MILIGSTSVCQQDEVQHMQVLQNVKSCIRNKKKSKAQVHNGENLIVAYVKKI